MRYGVIQLATSPPVEPLISTADAKKHLRVDYDYDDAVIDAFVAAATRQAEEYVGRAFVRRTFLLTLPAFPTNRIASGFPRQDWEVNPSRFGSSGTAVRYPEAIFFPYAPLVQVHSVVYYAGDDEQSPPQPVWETLASDSYVFTTAMEPGFIVPRAGRYWPHAGNHPEAVRITYDAGYGTPADVPADYIAAVKLILGHLYEHREDVTPGVNAPAPATLPYGARYMLGLTRMRMP